MLTPYWSSPCPVEGGGEVPQLLVEKILRYLGKCSTFSRSNREKNLFVCSFITIIAPFNSTLGNWEVMCSILPHDGIKQYELCCRIRISDLRSGCNKFYSNLGSNSLDDMLTPYWSSPCPVEGGGEVPQLLVEKILQYLGKCPLFRVQTERKICSSVLLLQWLPPSKESFGNWEGMCSIFFLMT